MKAETLTRMFPQLDSRTWRADLLQHILNVAVTLGALVYVLSITWAWQEGSVYAPGPVEQQFLMCAMAASADLHPELTPFGG